jgi:hypothetical protein
MSQRHSWRSVFAAIPLIIDSDDCKIRDAAFRLAPLYYLEK